MSEDAKTTAAWEQEVMRLANINADLVEALIEAEKYLKERVLHTGGTGERVTLPKIRAALNKAGVTHD